MVATADEDGRWRAEGLIGGARYHFSVDADDDWRGSGELTAIPGETVDVGDIKLRPHEE